MPRATRTSDIGFLIRNMLQDRTCSHIGLTCDEPAETPEADIVDHVNIFDPNSPRIHMVSGAVFRVTITREG